MLRGEIPNHLTFSSDEKAWTVEALRADDHNEAADALEAGINEVDLFALVFVKESLEKLVEGSQRPEAQAFLDSISLTLEAVSYTHLTLPTKA